MFVTQQELINVREELAENKAEVKKVRAKLAQAEVNSPSEAVLRQLELELVGLIRELQAKENRLSSQLGESLTVEVVLLI